RRSSGAATACSNTSPTPSAPSVMVWSYLLYPIQDDRLRAEEALELTLEEVVVVALPAVDLEVELPVDGVLLDERQHLRDPPPADRVGAVVVVLAGGQPAVDVVEGVQGDADLLEVVAALHSAGGLTDLLDGGQQQADQDGDDRYHHQQLDQRERST